MTARSDTPVLIAQDGPQAGQRWPLTQAEHVVGRGGDCDILINDKTVSRHHARIKREGDQWLLIDESKNGTHVNGLPTQSPHPLRDGDVIAIATAVRLAFTGSEATAPLALDLPTGRRLKLEIPSRRVWVNKIELDPPLSLPQYRLLELLYARSGQVCTREDVIHAVWPDAEITGVSEQSIDALVGRLRDRMGKVDGGHHYVITVRAQGFRLDNPAG